MTSEHSEHILYEVFTEKKMKKQNKIISVILGCLLIASVILFCLLIL